MQRFDIARLSWFGILEEKEFWLLARSLNMISPSDLQALFAKVEGTTVPVDLLRVGQSLAYGRTISELLLFILL